MIEIGSLNSFAMDDYPATKNNFLSTKKCSHFSFLLRNIIHLHHILMMIIMTLITLMKFNNAIFSLPNLIHSKQVNLQCDHYVSSLSLPLCAKVLILPTLLLLLLLLSLSSSSSRLVKLIIKVFFMLAKTLAEVACILES
jgi:hypothetical protein